jgi:hypothetical protein
VFSKNPAGAAIMGGGVFSAHANSVQEQVRGNITHFLARSNRHKQISRLKILVHCLELKLFKA